MRRTSVLVGARAKGGGRGGGGRRCYLDEQPFLPAGFVKASVWRPRGPEEGKKQKVFSVVLVREKSAACKRGRCGRWIA